ncbi:MAG TPA: isoamylase early set domain-containing protein [Lysobacter sp.]|jgi:1,4-alpha-glucan branching enzyme|nr:isoamylase early set domain-containing protein [Lysobacter sp.]
MAKKLTKSKTAAVEQTFAFKAHAASSVLLVGDFTHWQRSPVSLRKHSDGIWRVAVSLPPGEHRYRFLVDGEWRDDPECKLQVPNPFGSQDSVVQVSPA